ncbi:MAG TPA: kelch repeat-containing protein, partial [Acidimicrobiales bacterium]
MGLQRLVPPMLAAILLGACSGPGASVSSPPPTRVVGSASEQPVMSPTPTDTPAPTPTQTPEPLAWAQLELDGPSAREDHTWTLDPDGEVAYLFGGRDGSTVHDDTWAFDLGTDSWELLEPVGRPPARFGHETVWVDGVGLVIFGGQAGPSTFFGDLWAYDPASGAWRELGAGGAQPTARYGSCASLGPDGRLWISHGFTADQARFDDTRAYDFDAEAWIDETPEGDMPVARCL